MRTVYELTPEELEELELSLDEDEDVFEYYEGYSFVEEDFFCNLYTKNL